MTHTPGPWTVEIEDSETTITGTRNNQPCIIARELYDERNEPSLEELDANARLIAASPELLEACKAASVSFIGDDDYWKHKELVKVLNAAIAKAEQG